MNKIIEILISIPKTIYFNLKYLKPKQAMKLPIFISYNTKLKSLKGEVIINSDITPGMIRIGFGSVGIFDKDRRRTIIQLSGKVIFNGRAYIGHGSSLSVKGILEIGDNFNISCESKIVCHDNIIFGENVLISWDCLFMDTDSHKIFDSHNKWINKNKPIIIGSNVWFGCRTLILKGAEVGDGNIIAAGTTVNKKIDSFNSIVVGNPAKAIMSNVYWEM